MNLTKIVNKQTELRKKLRDATCVFEETQKDYNKEINELERLKNIVVSGVELEKVVIAEKIIDVRGNPYGTPSSGQKIALLAINDIADNFKLLKNRYFGNKKYEAYYQRCDCDYGMGPSHGSIVDRIELNCEYRKKVESITEEEKDACIYYLMSYEFIKASMVKNN